MRRPAWVVMTYVVLLLLAVATALPNFLPSTVRSTLPDWATSQTVSLGLDLQGGAHLLLAVDREDLAQSRLQALRETLVAEMGARNLNSGAIRTEPPVLVMPRYPLCGRRSVHHLFLFSPLSSANATQ